MKHLLAIDAWLISLTQEAYLWLWDRTGVYVATLIFAAVVVDHFCMGLNWFGFFVLAVAGLWCGYRYDVQSKDLRQLNALQEAWRDLGLRRICMVIMTAFLINDLAHLEGWRAASKTAFALWSYLGCVLVRDRDPKEFFQSRKMASATGGAA